MRFAKFPVPMSALVVVLFFQCGIVSGQEKETFPGQENLFALLKATGGFKGSIFLMDPDIGGTDHAKNMLYQLKRSVPEKNILTFEGVGNGTVEWQSSGGWLPNGSFWEAVKKNHVYVVHVPNGWVRYTSLSIEKEKESKLRILKEQDVIAVYSAGNFRREIDTHVDIYQTNDPYWGTEGRAEYQECEQYFHEGEGHVILGTYAIEKPATFAGFLGWSYGLRDEDGLREVYERAKEWKYIQEPLTYRPGSLKRYGFSVLLQERTHLTHDGKLRLRSGTSTASAHLAAFVFYLRQLWDSSAEVIEVMQTTATDIGEPGPDREFGWGLINVDHPLIRERAVQRLEESLEVYLFADVTLEQAIAVAENNLDVFHHIAEDKREIGLTFGTHKTIVAFAAGSTARPFGVSSRFLQQRNVAAQIGVRYSFTDTFSITGIYGRSRHEDFDVNKGSIGVDYQKHFLGNKGELSLYAGHRSIWGSLGLPGYDALDIAQTPFTLRMIEARASFALRF